MQTMEINGQVARVLDEGAGPTAILLHGWGGRIESMTPIIRCLGSSMRVVALDLPGFGESPIPRGVWATPDYAAFVKDVLDHLGVDEAFFVGHSFGAKVSFYLASIYPDLVKKLVLVGSPGLRTAPSTKARVKRAAGRAARVVGKAGPPGRALKEAVYRRIASTDYQEAGALRPILVAVVNEDFSELLKRISSPTLLVWGSNDDAAPVSHGQAMEQLIPDAGLVVFEGAGHFAYLDEPDRFCRIVRHFFGVVTGG